MSPLMRLFLMLGLAGVLAGCGVRAATFPHVPGAAASATPIPGGGPTPEAVPALQSVQTTYQGLPHTSVVSDLNALAPRWCRRERSRPRRSSRAASRRRCPMER